MTNGYKYTKLPAEFQKELERFSGEVREIQRQIEEKKREKKRLEDKIGEEKTIVFREDSQKQQRLSSLEKEIQELDREIKNLPGKYSSSIKALEQKIVELSREIEEIKKKASIRSQTWESDIFYSPFPISEKDERPYFPYMFLWVDNESGFILNHYIVEPTKQYSSEFIKQFLNLIQDIKIMPERILVRKPDIFVLLQPFASAFGIKLEITKELEMVKEARLHMTEFFKKK